MNNSENKQAFEPMRITCQDGYSLSARYYANSSGQSQQNPILICPATGISKNFYHHFAVWLSDQGFDVMSFDFRGIAESLHGELKDCDASIQDWGQLDIPAAIDSLLAKTQQQKITLLGHSAGGQLLGIVPNFNKVQRLIAVSGSTGHTGGLKGRTKLLAPLMFKLIFPISSRIKGYGATKFIGMGENLPKNVAKQWAEFCSRPGYVSNAIGKSIFEDYHQQIQCPITVYWSSDDEIATQANVQQLLSLYPHAETQMHELVPQQHGFKSIGHMAMFKRSHQVLWPILVKSLLTATSNSN